MGHRSSALRNTCSDLLSDSSEQMECLDLLHPLNHRHTKGTPFLAIPTGNAVFRPSAQCLVVSPDGLRDLGLHRRQVVELVDHGDVYALGAGSTVAAISTLSKIGMAWRTSQGAGVVPFLLGGRLIG